MGIMSPFKNKALTQTARVSPAQSAAMLRAESESFTPRIKDAEAEQVDLEAKARALAYDAEREGAAPEAVAAAEQAEEAVKAVAAKLQRLRAAKAEVEARAADAERKSRAIEIRRRLDRTEKRWDEMRINLGKLESSIAEVVAAYHAVLRDVGHLDFVGPTPVGCLTSANDVMRAVSHQLHKANGPTLGPDAMPPMPAAQAPDIMTKDNPGAVKPLSEIVAEADRVVRARLQQEKERLT
jgi:hypothetical protein